jgi:isoamylase
MDQWKIREGLPFPRGASWDGHGVNFALFSAHASKVELCLFDGRGERELSRIELPEHTDQIWHGYLPDDEFARTQGGNNNAYCQDNQISWLDWEMGEKGKRLLEFTRQLTALRHQYPMLRHNRFLKGSYNEELNVKDVTWLNANGSEMEPEHWADDEMRCFGMMLNGLSQQTGIRKRGQEATLLVVFNAHYEAVNFQLPSFGEAAKWSVLIDTNVAEGKASGSFSAGDRYLVTDRALLLFVLA